MIYPIGSIYMSINNTNPSTLFGGTWTQLKDRFLLGAGSTYSNGATGGEATHTLTESEMPAHTHKTSFGFYETGNSGYTFAFERFANNVGERIVESNYTGGGKPHNNMPPYLAVYMWKRTA